MEHLYSSTFGCEVEFHRLNIAARMERELEWCHGKSAGVKILLQKLEKRENFYLLRFDKLTTNNSYMTISLPSQILR